MSMNRDLSENEMRKKNSLLSQYYGTSKENGTSENPLDLDGKHFEAEIFVDKLVKVKLFLKYFLAVLSWILTSYVCRNLV